MKIKISILFLLYINITNTIPSNIIIRNAIQKDLPSLFELDRIVSYEYFLPMYRTGYSHISLGKNPEYFLNLELEQDKKWFPECINNEQLWVAYDQDNNKIAGLIIAHKNSQTIMEIDLLLVLQEYRGKGIGKALVYYIIDAFPDITVFEVYPLKFVNDGTLAFYKVIGFINNGIPTIDKVNIYGIHYKEMYYYFTYNTNKI